MKFRYASILTGGSLVPYLLLVLLLSHVAASPSFSSERKRQTRELVRQTWKHSFDAYMRVAFPLDELAPLSCSGIGHDRQNAANTAVNDICGDYALTLVDTLDTFVVMRDKSGFERAVRDVIHHVHFNVDSKVQVFEVTIRMLGGLLSGHIFASEPKHGFKLPWYKGELLTLAQDLGRRLLPAFTHSPTGIPFPRINLKRGLMAGESTETCAAAAGSLLLEFATLSRLTGEPVYENVAKKALFAVWNSRSDFDLIGNTIDMKTGKWGYAVASTGAGIDSIFEYMLKSYILLDEFEYWRVFDDAYSAIMRYVRASEGFWYRGVNMYTGIAASNNIDSLSAFWPGLQVLAGDIESAIKSHSVFANIWRRYSGLPEVFSIVEREAKSLAYPLRPELVESTLFLYQATQDDEYLKFGERMVHDIVNRSRTDCGLAGVDNLLTGELDNRMHSFALSETLKYAYLLFDELNVYNHDDSSTIYTTEGHLIPLHKRYLHINTKKSRSTARSTASQSCSAYNVTFRHASPLWHSIRDRTDAIYSEILVDLEADTAEAIRTGRYSIYGFCEKPIHEEYVMDLIFASDGKGEDTTPSLSKLQPDQKGFIVRNVQNLRVQLVKRSNPDRYEISKLGLYRVSSNQMVRFTDPLLWQSVQQAHHQHIHPIDMLLHSSSGNLPAQGQAAAFGPALSSPQCDWGVGKPAIQVVHVPDHEKNSFGCEAYSLLPPYSERQHLHEEVRAVVLAKRGMCSFVTKSKMAAQAGAKGLLVANLDEELFVAGGDTVQNPKTALVPMLMLANTTGRLLETLLSEGKSEVFLEITREHPPEETQPSDMFTVNGLNVANARLSREP